MQLKEKRRSRRPHRLRRLRGGAAAGGRPAHAPLPFTQRFDLALLDRALAQLQEEGTDRLHPRGGLDPAGRRTQRRV